MTATRILGPKFPKSPKFPYFAPKVPKMGRKQSMAGSISKVSSRCLDHVFGGLLWFNTLITPILPQNPILGPQCILNGQHCRVLWRDRLVNFWQEWLKSITSAATTRFCNKFKKFCSKTAKINVKNLLFLHQCKDDRSKTAKINLLYHSKRMRLKTCISYGGSPNGDLITNTPLGAR